MSKKHRVLVGMSGGVDSSVTCILLQQQGYEVAGVTLRMWDTPSKFKQYQQSDPDYIVEARELAGKLGIEHHVLDLRQSFRSSVIQYFMDDYYQGRTPNPCIMCNREFKFKYLLELADQLDCPHVATGHYAKVAMVSGIYYIQQADDQLKDQSYFLWRLSQEQLSRLLLPLGSYHKDQIRQIAKENGYERVSVKSDSMEICFLDGDYRDFLRQMDTRIGTISAGNFIDRQGKTIGSHQGFPFYTIGQRKGLQIALGYPAHVVKINPKSNTIQLGTKEDLTSQYMLVEAPLLHRSIDPEQPLSTKIRYKSQAIGSRVRILDNGAALVTFDTPVSAVTPGQSAVFYIGDTVVGGAIIGSQKGINQYKTET